MIPNDYDAFLTKELATCQKTIERIRKSLDLLERKHGKTTEAFIAELRAGSLPDSPELRVDWKAWESSYESLTSWENLERQYREARRGSGDQEGGPAKPG